MSGGVFIMAIIAALAVVMIAGFVAIARFDPANRPARWFALAFGLGLLNPIGELTIAAGIAVQLAWMVVALSYLAALLVATYALSLRFAVDQDPLALAAIFAVSAVLYYFLFGLPRESFWRNLLYQMPYALVFCLALWIGMRSRTRGLVEAALIAVLAIAPFYFLAKPFLAPSLGGIGAESRDYADTTYALVSQTSAAILTLTLGMLCLFMAGHDSMANIVRRSEQDGQTGRLNRRAFEDRAGAWLLAPGSGPGRKAALILCALDSGGERQTGAGRRGKAWLEGAVMALSGVLGTLEPKDDVIVGRLGVTQFAALIPDTDLFSARTQAEAIGTALRETPRTTATASFGVAEHEPGDALSDLLARAEWALAEAQRAGGDCVRLAAQAGFAITRP